jgi:hypothetical protein
MIPLHLLIYFPIIIGIAVLVGVLVYYNRKLARIRRSFEELAKRVHGRISRKFMYIGDLLEGQHGAIPFTCRYFMGSKNSPPSLTIQAQIPCSVKLTIRQENWYDRFARKIGLMAELQTGDAVFDQAYLLETEQDDAVQSCLSDEGKRREIDTLFHLGFPVREIVFGKNYLRIVLSPFQEHAIAPFQWRSTWMLCSISPADLPWGRISHLSAICLSPAASAPRFTKAAWFFCLSSAGSFFWAESSP